MLKLAAAVIVLATLAGCAGPQKKEPVQNARCNEQPQWVTKDEKGNDLGIYICFGENSRLLYVVRVLPPVPPPAAKKAPERDPKTGRFKAPVAAPVVLPSVSGTAK